MKICIFTHTFPRFPGDTPAPFMENLAKALADLGHDVFVLMPFDSMIQKNAQRNYKLVTYRYAFPDSFHILGYSREFDSGKNLRIITYLLAPLLIFFGVIALIRLIAREKIEVVSAHWIIPSGFITAISNFFTNTPYTVTMPGSDIYLGGKNILFRTMVGLSAKRASYVMADNVAYMDQLISLGITPKRQKIIVYGADAKKFSSQKKDKKILKSLKIEGERKIILAVGRLVPKKGFIYLIRALPQVVKKLPKIKLLIVGDGGERTILEEEVKKLNLLDNVIFAGTINYNDLVKYYNLGNVFVMPSIRDESGNIDASPVAMMEAMACGTPVVATSFSGSSEIVIEGKTGYLVEEKNSKQIAAAILKILGSKDIDQLRKNVRKTAVENFSTEAIAKRYTQIFEEIVR